MTTRRPVTWGPPRAPLWTPTTHRRGGVVVAPPSFSGLLDALTAVPEGAYAMRRLTGSSWGTDDSVTDPLIRVRRASDNDEQNFTYNGSGILDAAAVATFLSATTGFGTKWFDQSGNGYDGLQATALDQPAYVASSMNSLPAFEGAGGADRFDADYAWTGINGTDLPRHGFMSLRTDLSPDRWILHT